MNWGESEGVMEKQNDIGKDFPFDERDPMKILSHFENHPFFKEDEGLQILRNFIEYRLRNPDPRFGKPDKPQSQKK